MSPIYHPLISLKEGNWFKLICGASFQHLPAVRSLALAYTLAGADCIDMAADPAVIAAVKEGINAAKNLTNTATGQKFNRESWPWLMVSLNDGEDPHFRKAQFDSTQCPQDCSRPCIQVCPAQAINHEGIIDQRCYGCGRCLPVCPTQLIFTRSSVSTPASTTSLINNLGIDALEIHTQVGRLWDFQRLWQAISPAISQLKLLSISCQDHPDLINYLTSLYELIQPLPCPLIWQTDGRPMSGDLGKGTTHATIKLAQKVLAANLPGYIQLAGGTNGHTITKLKEYGLLSQRTGSANHHTNNSRFVAGVAYGSYARSLLTPILQQLEIHMSPSNEEIMPFVRSISQLEECPLLLWQAVYQAQELVAQLKPTFSAAPSHSLA